jgi:hypothetical protein
MKKNNGRNYKEEDGMGGRPQPSVITARHQRWNPEYPPGKPGKPHPVGCALNGDGDA